MAFNQPCYDLFDKIFWNNDLAATAFSMAWGSTKQQSSHLKFIEIV